MKKLAFAFTSPVLLAFAACSEPQPANTNSVEDFAARINGAGSGAQASTQTENGAQSGAMAVSGETSGIEPPPANANVSDPVANASRGIFTPGTFTDPDSATCGANQMGAFIGREATRAVRGQIEGIIGDANEVRFVLAGSGFVAPDASSPRLNIMLDRQDVIRDARCG